MSEEFSASHLTLRVGGTRSLKVSDGFVTFEFCGTEMNVRASAIVAYRLRSHIETRGVSVPAIELTAADKEYVVVNPCVEDWVEFKDAIKSYRTTVKGGVRMTDNHNHHFGAGDGIPVELPVIVHDEPARN